MALNLRHLEVDRQLGIGSGEDRHREPTSSQMTRKMGNNKDHGGRSEERTRPGGNQRENIRQNTTQSAWRGKFDGPIVGIKMYSGETYVDAYEMIRSPENQSIYIEFLQSVWNNSNLSVELNFSGIPQVYGAMEESENKMREWARSVTVEAAVWCVLGS